MFMVLRLCRAATAIPMVVSVMSANMAIGGIPLRILVVPTAEIWVMVTSMSVCTISIRTTARSVFVACRIERVVSIELTGFLIWRTNNEN